VVTTITMTDPTFYQVQVMWVWQVSIVAMEQVTTGASHKMSVGSFVEFGTVNGQVVLQACMTLQMHILG
jgi:hypothetical protein